MLEEVIRGRSQTTLVGRGSVKCEQKSQLGRGVMKSQCLSTKNVNLVFFYWQNL